MDAKATIQKYISPIPKKAIAWATLALSLLLIGVGVAQTCRIKLCDTPLDLQTAKSGQLVYADIVGISGPIDQGRGFALDANGNIFLISFLSDDLAEYEAQLKYWKGEGEAEPLRMVFSASTLSFAHRHTMADYWGMELEAYEQ